MANGEEAIGAPEGFDLPPGQRQTNNLVEVAEYGAAERPRTKPRKAARKATSILRRLASGSVLKAAFESRAASQAIERTDRALRKPA